MVPLSAAAPDVKLAVFDGTTMVTPPVDVSGAPQQNRPADTVTTTAGLHALRFPWIDPDVPIVGTPATTSITSDLTKAIAAEGTANNSNFAYVWWGHINVPAAGTYTFATNSDDGSVVWIDNVQVVDNDGQHGPVEVQGAPIALAAGKHPIRIAYDQGGGGCSFELRWIKPGATATAAVPASALSHA